MDREEMLSMLTYFWQEKGDIERWSSFDREKVAAEFPELLKAWDDYVTAHKVMNAVVSGLSA